MRVIQLGPFPPPHGGVQTNLKAIHDLLVESGHEGAVIAITRSSKTDNVPNIYKPRSAYQLLNLLLTLRFDIVHLHIGGNFTFRLAALMLVCGFLPGRKSVVTFHSGGYARDAVKFARPFSFRGIAFRSVDFVIGVNPQMLEMFRAFGVRESKLGLIQPFVFQMPDPGIKIPQHLFRFIEEHQPFLLTVSGLETEYELSMQIDALESIRAKFPKAGLMILGSGSLEQNLRELIAEKEYAKAICLAGDVDHPISLHLIEKAAMMLRTTQYDGDAVSVREALFLRTPVLATDNGMRPEGVTLISSSPWIEDLVEKVFEVLDRGGEQISVKMVGGRENIEAVLNVYEDLLQK